MSGANWVRRCLQSRHSLSAKPRREPEAIPPLGVSRCYTPFGTWSRKRSARTTRRLHSASLASLLASIA